MDFDRLLRVMVEQEASDLFLKAGNHPFLRIDGKLIPAGTEKVTREQLTQLAAVLMGSEQRQAFHADREQNFAFERDGIGRFRANVLWQRGTIALVIRRVNRAIPSFQELHLPAETLTRLLGEQHGLILVTGATGTGKSTTTAAMLDFINQTSAKHIMTLEDPVEFQFQEHKAIINQREIGSDTRSFSEGLKNVLRQSPDVLYLSDIRDRETMEAALTASEAGQLVLSCLHTTNCVTTVERIIAFFPSSQHHLVRLRLSLVLRGIISLRLLLRKDGNGRIPVCEILTSTPTVKELLREGQTGQLPLALQDGGMFGMQTFTQALHQRYRKDEVTLEEALRYADSPQELQLAVRDIRSIRDTRS